MVEIDSTFARTVGLVEGQRVAVLLHLDPPLAHTINIEPLTPGDWEIIELHATFLELNLQSQIRALPNPSHNSSPSAQARQVHPLTLHLSPTSTANIIVSSLTPPLSSSQPFAKLAPDAEVIVAPKTRPRAARNNRAESRSVTSVGHRSAGGKSSTGTTRSKSSKPAIFLRGVDRAIFPEWFDDEEESEKNIGLRIWVDRDVLIKKNIKGAEMVCVSILRPAALQSPLDQHQMQKIKDQENSEVGKHSSRVLTKLVPWDDAPDTRCTALSSTLCVALGVDSVVGGVVRIEPAPQELPKTSVHSLKLYPFADSSGIQTDGLRFGGETRASREAAAGKIKEIYGDGAGFEHGILTGPLTDGTILPKSELTVSGRPWNGGLLRFGLPPSTTDHEKSPVRWISQGSKLDIQVQQEILNPYKVMSPEGDQLPGTSSHLLGVDELVSRLMSSLSHLSSVLLNGGLGSGKTSISQLVARRLQRDHIYHVTYFPCRKLVSEETRIGTIKDTFNRLFMGASLGSSLGGSSLVILDDLDRLCPTETELQVGNENGRSRQISELLCSTIHQYCGAESRVAVLMTAQGKDSLNSMIIGAHVVRDIVDLKAPDKQARRKILESLSHQPAGTPKPTNGYSSQPDLNSGENAWMDGSLPSSRQNSPSRGTGMTVSRDLDFLDVAGQTDGYMPGDLELLASRARSEAMIRLVHQNPNARPNTKLELSLVDFQEAIKGFTPASLRNVTLQTSSTTFDSIGGLKETRKVLLETLQYPTTYAPIFAQCPLRLRSGLLLYGYPGCGKTLLASAVAGECGLNFISVKGPEILNKYIGASEKSVRDLFERAEAAKPCVLFFDEFDSIAPKRGHDSTGVTDRVVNQLLTQMDGAEGLSGVYVLAATSRPDLIDPALLRPGRLDKSLICDMPNLDDRLDILQALSKKLNISADVLTSSTPHHTLIEIAHRTEGYSGADLQAVIYNAHLEAIHDILGDQKGSSSTSKAVTRSEKQNGMEHHHQSSPSRARELIKFRFGEEEDRRESAERTSTGINRSKQALENAALLAKLEAAKLERRASRQARQFRLSPNTSATSSSNGAQKFQSAGKDRESEVEVVIQWKHLETSLAQTRRSIGEMERRKLEGVYREFLRGRSGEVRGGEGSTDVGGRVSLM